MSLSLVSEGNSNRGGVIDYVLKYERPRSFLIEAAHSSFVVGETRGLTRTIVSASNALDKGGKDEPVPLGQQRLDAPHWEGKQLRVAVGRTSESGEEMTVGFSVLNSSARTIELLPPQIQLAGTSKSRHRKAIKADPVAIKDYRMTARRLGPGERSDGVVVFGRPSFKESRDELRLQIAQAEEVDRPVLAPIAFVAPAKGGTK